MPAVFAMGEAHRSMRGVLIEWGALRRATPSSRGMPLTTDASPITLRGWALILGASSGFGAATSLALARAGLDVFGVHLDRKSTLPNVERLAGEITALGRHPRFFNVNAADEEKPAEAARCMGGVLGGGERGGSG